MLNKSKNFNENYSARIVRVESIEPIENANAIVRATVGENKIVVGNSTKVGDILVYFPVGTVINPTYLRINNLYQNPEHNDSKYTYSELKHTMEAIQARIDYPGREAELQRINYALKKLTGMFNPNGRVRMIKLRGVYSEGFAAPVETLERAWPVLKNVIWSKHIGEIFDEVAGAEVCHKWLPPKNEEFKEDKRPWWEMKQRKLKKMDKIIPGTFEFHYDTTLLENNVGLINPTDMITVTVKLHGTSAILSHVPVKRDLKWYEKVKKWLGLPVKETDYANIYSSRRVIQNKEINAGKPDKSFYGGGDYDALQRDLADYIPKDTTVYGELVGYKEGTNKCYQSPCRIDHDYGCAVGEWAFMPYRINHKGTEFTVEEVREWTEMLIALLPEEDKRKVIPINILYSGPAGEMYNLYKVVCDAVTVEDYEKAKNDYINSTAYGGYLPPYLESITNYINHLWRIEWLEAMKEDKVLLGMELPEPMCNNKKAPREGVVVRLTYDTEKRAFKLKTKAHKMLSQKSADVGEADPEDLA